MSIPTLNINDYFKLFNNYPLPEEHIYTGNEPGIGGTSTEKRAGRPVVLEDWKRISIVFEQRHIDAMDAAIYAKKTDARKRYSYSDVVRWLVDKHLKDF
jgi:hypothetical protein